MVEVSSVAGGWLRRQPWAGVLGCSGLFWAALGWSEFLWAVLGCFGLFWAVLACFELLWAALVWSGLFWSALLCFGMFFVQSGIGMQFLSLFHVSPLFGAGQVRHWNAVFVAISRKSAV